MKKINVLIILFLYSINVCSQKVADVFSPDRTLAVQVYLENGKPMYKVTYKDNVMLENSPLGLLTNEGDFSSEMKFITKKDSSVNKQYEQQKIKKSYINYHANTLLCRFENAQN